MRLDSLADGSRAFATGTSERKILRRGPGRLLPHRLGDYTLFDHIGRGGMADIYRARTTTSLGAEREVVIKEVLPELRDIPRFAELLASEARLASGLTHANIVTVEHLGRDDGTLYIAMEYVEGLDLRELLRRCAKGGVPLPVDFALWMVLEVLTALSYAHRFRVRDDAIGIVHRDVSPSNVLLSFDGELKLCDFGIAKANTAATGVTDDAIEGKAGYMSPEQARGEGVTPRSDLYAVGIILWELVSGRRLYKAAPGESLVDVAARAEVPPFALRGLPREAELCALLHRALARDPAARFGSADEMREALEDYAVRADLRTSSLRFGQWICEHFQSELVRARRAREKAVRALALGPVAEIRPVPPRAGGSSDSGTELEPTPTDTHARTHSEIRRKKTGTRRRATMSLGRPAGKQRAAAGKHKVAKRTDKQPTHPVEEIPPSLAATTTDIEDAERATTGRRTTSRWPLVVLLVLGLVGAVVYLLR